MPFPQEPLNPTDSAVDRVRLLVGDIDPIDVELVHELYEYFLVTNEGDEGLSALQAVKALVAKYAKYVEEETDYVKAKWKERYEGYRDLQNELIKTTANFSIYASGISWAERSNDRCNVDLRDNQFTVGKASGYNNKQYEVL